MTRASFAASATENHFPSKISRSPRRQQQRWLSAHPIPCQMWIFSLFLSFQEPCPPNLSLSFSPPSMLLRREKLMFSMGMLMRNCAPRSTMASSAGHCSISNNNLEMPRIMTKFTMRSPAGKRKIHARIYWYTSDILTRSLFPPCAYCCPVTCGIMWKSTCCALVRLSLPFTHCLLTWPNYNYLSQRSSFIGTIKSFSL